LARETGDYHRGPFVLWRRRHGPGRRSYACLRIGNMGKKNEANVVGKFRMKLFRSSKQASFKYQVGSGRDPSQRAPRGMGGPGDPNHRSQTKFSTKTTGQTSFPNLWPDPKGPGGHPPQALEGGGAGGRTRGRKGTQCIDHDTVPSPRMESHTGFKEVHIGVAETRQQVGGVLAEASHFRPPSCLASTLVCGNPMRWFKSIERHGSNIAPEGNDGIHPTKCADLTAFRETEDKFGG